MENNNPIRKTITYLLLFTIIIVIVSFISLNFLVPSDSTKEGFQLTVSGLVETNVDNESLPQYVWVYKEYAYLDRLYEEGKVIKLTNIQWDMDNGKYATTFWLPIEQRIILTTYPPGCNHRHLDVSKENNVFEIDLKHNQNICSSDSITIPEDITQIEKRVKDGLKRDFSDSTDSSFTSNQTKAIQEDIDLAEDEFKEFDSIDDSSLINLYKAFWLDWRASYRIEIYRAQSCMKNILPVLTESKSCIVYPYDVIEGLKSINNSIDAFGESSSIFNKNAYHRDTIEQIKSGIYTISQNSNLMREYQRDCEDYTKIINKSKENQEMICKMRETSIFILTWSQALAFVCIGFIVYSSIRKWIEK